MKVEVFIFEHRKEAVDKIEQLQHAGRSVIWDGVEHDGRSLASGLLSLEKPGILDFLMERADGHHIVIAAT